MKEKAGYYISNLLTAIVNLRELSATLYAVYKPGARNKLNICKKPSRITNFVFFLS
jgi:hypothetical protein